MTQGPVQLPEPPVGVREKTRIYRAVLVDVNTVTAFWSLPPDTVLAMIDCGQIRWAWDVSVHQARERCVRIWLQELFNPAGARALDAGAVAEAVIGHSTELRLRGRTVSQILTLDRRTVHDLVVALELSGVVEEHHLWVTRASLVDFLRRRLIA